MQTTVTFNKAGYDPFIDFIKAYAIICVLIGHTFPSLNLLGYGLWAGMQVPLFILVQSFHFLKKDTSIFSWKKIIWRIFVPFIVVEVALYLLLLSTFPNLYSWDKLLVIFFLGGGTGPGSYYPWIYLQIALMLPFMGKWMREVSKVKLTIVFLLFCEGFEILFSIVNLPDYLYRLLAIRYVFLIFLAWIWVRDGIVLNTKTAMLSLISFMSIVYFEYFSINDEPLFYNTAWKYHRWPCYYYLTIWGGYFLFLMHQVLSKYPHIVGMVRMLAKCSYEIFLIQMAACVLCPSFEFISNSYLRIVFRIVIIFSVSITGGYVMNKQYSVFMSKHVK